MLRTLLDRLRNDVTRLAAVRGVAAISKSPLELPAVCDAAFLQVGAPAQDSGQRSRRGGEGGGGARAATMTGRGGAGGSLGVAPAAHAPSNGTGRTRTRLIAGS